jgi:hypothetical protein
MKTLDLLQKHLPKDGELLLSLLNIDISDRVCHLVKNRWIRVITNT